ncbi:MAG: heavy metal translocating P-type ATPase [Clostridia bacterium]|nr:heavy metal translocating P-type ATPase [Clostridia bacterium]
MERYDITGMSCAACSARVEKAVSAVEGVRQCSVNLLTNSMSVEGTASETDIIKAVEKAGYGAAKKGRTRKSRSDENAFFDKEIAVLKKRLIISAAFLIVLMYFSMGRMMFHFPAPKIFDNLIFSAVFQMIIAIIVMAVNRKFYKNGFSAVLKGAANMDTLVAVGSSAAFLFSLAALIVMIKASASGNTALLMQKGMNLYFESAAMIPTLITVGKLLEAISKGRTTDALRGLMSIAPKTAVLYNDGQETEVPVERIAVGDIFAVKAGGSIPVDGEVIFGSAAVDESMLTGESVPSEKQEKSPVFAGTISKSGYIRCRATKVGEDTTLSAVIKTVSDANSTKAPIGRIADKVSGVFVPAVMLIAVLTFIGWMIAGKDAGFSITRAITVLVISCPCALGLATPVAIMVGSGVGAKNGILYKTAASLENFGKIKTVALDKTGTITTGKPTVTDVIPLGVSAEELIIFAASVENQSEHPLALAVVEKAKEKKLFDVTDFDSFAGNGVKGIINGDLYEGGSYKYILDKTFIAEDIKEKIGLLAESGKTPILFTKNDILIGVIAVADTVREDTPFAVGLLKKLGVKVVMLTGDNKKTAAAIGKIAGIDKFFAEVLPNEKAGIINELKKTGKTAMVGDGINDAPALTVADSGVAMGSGTDIAADSADIVIMKNRLSDVAAAVTLSRATIKNIYENLFWAFFYNAVCIPLAIGLYGIEMKPVYGAAAMALSSVCVCLNALRLNRVKFAYNNEKTDNIKENETMEKTILVEGMMCEHCEARVKAALEEIAGVKSAAPDHNAKKVTVTLIGDIPDETLSSAIETAGYKVTGIE